MARRPVVKIFVRVQEVLEVRVPRAVQLEGREPNHTYFERLDKPDRTWEYWAGATEHSKRQVRAHDLPRSVRRLFRMKLRCGHDNSRVDKLFPNAIVRIKHAVVNDDPHDPPSMFDIM